MSFKEQFLTAIYLCILRHQPLFLYGTVYVNIKNFKYSTFCITYVQNSYSLNELVLVHKTAHSEIYI